MYLTLLLDPLHAAQHTYTHILFAILFVKGYIEELTLKIMEMVDFVEVRVKDTEHVW